MRVWPHSSAPFYEWFAHRIYRLWEPIKSQLTCHTNRIRESLFVSIVRGGSALCDFLKFCSRGLCVLTLNLILLRLFLLSPHRLTVIRICKMHHWCSERKGRGRCKRKIPHAKNDVVVNLSNISSVILCNESSRRIASEKCWFFSSQSIQSSMTLCCMNNFNFDPWNRLELSCRPNMGRHSFCLIVSNQS